MKKTTKSLWGYAAILFIIAIALIATASLLQARLITSNGGVEVLGTFTKNANQNIAKLTEENIKLTNELNAMVEQNNALKVDLENLSNSEATQSRQKEIMRQMYIAFRYEKYDELEALFKMIDEQQLITREEADKFIPELYDRARAFLEPDDE